MIARSAGSSMSRKFAGDSRGGAAADSKKAMPKPWRTISRQNATCPATRDIRAWATRSGAVWISHRMFSKPMRLVARENGPLRGTRTSASGTRRGHAPGGFDRHRNPAGRLRVERLQVDQLPGGRERVLMDGGNAVARGPADDRSVRLGLQVVDVDAHDDGAMLVEAVRLDVTLGQQVNVPRDVPGTFPDDPCCMLIYRRCELHARPLYTGHGAA